MTCKARKLEKYILTIKIEKGQTNKIYYYRIQCSFKAMKVGLIVVLLCKWNVDGGQPLLSILNEQNGKQVIQKCYQISQYTTFGTKKIYVCQTNKSA